MRFLIVGDAVVASGFARCTHAAADAMHAMGHEVHILGINYFGDPHNYPYKIYPCRQPLDNGRDGFGVSRLPTLIDRLRPDAVLLLNDPWNVPHYLQAIKEYESKHQPPVIGWLAVDGENQLGSERLNDLAAVITWTEFGLTQLRAGGYTGAARVIPLGITSAFHPRDKIESRKVTLPPNSDLQGYIVGVVGRNQPRKRLDLAMQYFAECRELDDATLYMHVAPTGDSGVNLHAMAKYYGLFNRVILAEPGIGSGIGEDIMPLVYSSFDALFTTTQGEGWGLTTMEAMACGVPCVVPDWSALGEWPGDAVIKVPCSTQAVTAPLNQMAYTVGGIPDKDAMIAALASLRNSPELSADYSIRGLELTSQKQFRWSEIGTRVTRVAEQAARGLYTPTTPEGQALPLTQVENLALQATVRPK